MMKKKINEHVYQFKITLRDIRPPIWRRVQVPETYSFWDLHVAIQDAMGWTDTHLHEFRMPDPGSSREVEIGLPSEFASRPLIEWKTRIASFFSLENPRARYTYDFGDNWEHLIALEKILKTEPGVEYPRCIKGKRACPPEDCGGPWGYYDLLQEMNLAGTNDSDEDSYDMDFDPESFDCGEILFCDPKKSLKTAQDLGLF